MKRDLFGQPLRERKSRIERDLERHDRDSFAGRLDRLRWLEKVFPKGYSFMMSIEVFHAFEEARATFVNGQFVATLLLVNAFLEHWLGKIVASKGYEKEARRGLSAILHCMEDNNLAHPYLTGTADRLRKIRNPFTHLKPLEHEYRLDQRVFREKRLPEDVLEEDARDAVSLMLQIATTRF